MAVSSFSFYLSFFFSLSFSFSLPFPHSLSPILSRFLSFCLSFSSCLLFLPRLFLLSVSLSFSFSFFSCLLFPSPFPFMPLYFLPSPPLSRSLAPHISSCVLPSSSFIFLFSFPFAFATSRNVSLPVLHLRLFLLLFFLHLPSFTPCDGKSGDVRRYC